MNNNELVEQIKSGTLKFSDVIAFIDAHFIHEPTAFKNGEASNAATENQGSAKVLSYARIEGLNQDQTLALFAEHYQSVLDHPEGTDHQNIRQFMENGWKGVFFDGVALRPKTLEK